jgi:uncharacterized protein YbjT (DUF2867 family)
MRVLVLGAYGLIGAGITRHLRAAGFETEGLGRNEQTARRVFPQLGWIIRDMASMRALGDWIPVIDGFDAVVNCAGALQDGPRDSLQAIHSDAVAASPWLARTRECGLCKSRRPAFRLDATTMFFRSKAQGDAAIRAAGGDFTILRPGLVIAPTAYGGTALLRMLAAFPLVQPIAFPDTPVRTVSLGDLAGAVEMARGRIGLRRNDRPRRGAAAPARCHRRRYPALAGIRASESAGRIAGDADETDQRGG